MENFTLISKQNLKEFIGEIHYGSNLVYYSSEDIRKQFLSNIEIVNEVLGSNFIREVQYEDGGIENGHFVSEEIPNLYNLISSFTDDIPELTDHDFDIKNIAEKAIQEKSRQFFKIDHRLFKMAGRIAFARGIKFGNDFGGQYFDATEKQLPLSKQIHKAYFDGEESISFDASKHSVSTVRCYASTLAQQTGKKIKCTISPTKITVLFKEPLEIQKFIDKSNELLLEYINKTSAEECLHELIVLVDKNIKKYNLNHLKIEKAYTIPVEEIGRKAVGDATERIEDADF